jgi:tetratricopeptide (TPR) repeat protein
VIPTSTARHLRSPLILIVVTLAWLGCVPVAEVDKQTESGDIVARGALLLAQGDYQGAIRENEQALATTGGKAPRDQALFQLGLLYADAANPQKNHAKAMQFFRKLLWDFPRSPLAPQSKIWLAVLEENGRLSRQQEEIGRTRAGLSRENQRLAEENRKLSEKTQAVSQENQKLNQENEKLSQENQKLKNVLEETKRVDLEIEQKKKETQR